jgi:hypothetical protein
MDTTIQKREQSSMPDEITKLQNDLLALVLEKTRVDYDVLIETAKREFVVSNLDVLSNSELKKFQKILYVHGIPRYRVEREPTSVYLRKLAKSIDNSVIKNDISMQEIVDEVHSVRKEIYEKQNRL